MTQIPTTQIPTILHCLRVTVWTSDILSLITCSQHNMAQQTRRPISAFSLSHSPSSAPSLSFSFVFHSYLGLRMRAEEEGCGKQGRGEKERLAPANNPLFRHLQLHISKLHWSARKRAYKTLNVLWLHSGVHIPPLTALPSGPAEYCGICSAGVNESHTSPSWSGPGREARANHFEVKQCNLDLVSAIYFARQTEALKHFLFFSPSPLDKRRMLFGRERAGPTEVRHQRPFFHWREKCRKYRR